MNEHMKDNGNSNPQISVKIHPNNHLDSIKDIKLQLNNLINHQQVGNNEEEVILNYSNADIMQYLAEHNEEAVQLINSDSFEEALKLLTQAEEKISQLGQIESTQETYIITIFYNIA